MFKSIQPLFANKPVLLVCNKIDVVRLENLKDEDKEQINSLCRDGVELVPMSTATEEGVSSVKELVKLLASDGTKLIYCLGMQETVRT